MPNYDDDTTTDTEIVSVARTATKIAAGVVLTLVLLIGGCQVATPQLNLYKKNTEKRAVIAEQKAKSQAAEYAARSRVTQAQAKADAEVIRAKGLAEAQAIISETLTPEYLRYLYIDAIAGSDGQIIYVPTEAGLPVLEADRLSEQRAGD